MPEEAKETKKVEMPPYPMGLFDWTNEQKRFWEYYGHPDSIKKRASHKLWNVWLTWVDLHNNEKLIEIIGKETKDKESNEFLLKQTLVLVIDRLGKILSTTNLAEEVVKLRKSDDDKEKDKFDYNISI